VAFYWCYLQLCCGFKKGQKNTSGFATPFNFLLGFGSLQGLNQLVLKKFSTITFILSNPLLLGFLELFLSFSFFPASARL